jgi:putative SOS response-associated peptidase YedK
VETAPDKPSFRHAFRKRRCLIVADGFYEWKGGKGRKQPWFIFPPTSGPFGFAGLWETWNKGDKHTPHRSCTILTTEASQTLRDIHHRMPVILHPEGWNAWLDPANQDASLLQQVLQENHCREFNFYAVSTRVNRATYNDADCIAPLKESVDENNTHP